MRVCRSGGRAEKKECLRIFCHQKWENAQKKPALESDETDPFAIEILPRSTFLKNVGPESPRAGLSGMKVALFDKHGLCLSWGLFLENETRSVFFPNFLLRVRDKRGKFFPP